MGIVSATVGAVKTNFLTPRNLFIGIGVTAGTLFLLSRVLPGLGGMVGLRTGVGLLPVPFWPFSIGKTASAVPGATQTNAIDAAWEASH